MKNKFLILIAAICMALTLLGAPAAASAQADESKKACIGFSRSTSVNLSFAGDGGGLKPARKATHTVNMRMIAYARNCGNYVMVDSLEYQIDPDFVGCINGYVQNFKVNPNAIGSWNPGERTKDCSAGVGYYGIGVSTPYQVQVFQSAPANERCIAARMQVSLTGTEDKFGTTPSICLI